jgi:hypothetical protein
MENKYFQASPHDKRALVEKIGVCLKHRPEIAFAYLHGSFANSDRFRDVDLAVYLNPPSSSPLAFELQLETELGNLLGPFPIEIRVLNNAPLSFRFKVIEKGELLFVTAENLRCDFVEATLRDYFDFAPFRKLYLKEALGSGI